MTSYINNPDKPLRGSYAVYFAGTHVPAENVTINNSGWSMPQANIVVPASDLMLRFGHDDRVQVAIFYLDHFFEAEEESKYRLIFDGEITSWSLSRSSASSNIAFTAVSHLQIFAELFIDFITSLQDHARGSIDMGDGASFKQYYATFPGMFFKKGLTPDGDFIKRPYEFVRNMLQALATEGVASGAGSSRAYLRSTPAIKFFDKHRKFIKMAKRFCACPVVEDRLATENNFAFPLIEAVGNQSVIRALVQQSMGFNSKTSAWQLLYTVFNLMFYDILFLNAAPYILSDLNGNILTRGSTDYPRTTDDHMFLLLDDDADVPYPLKDDDGNEIKIVIDEAYQVEQQPFPVLPGAIDGYSFPQLGQFVTKPLTSFAIPPLCNVVFPSMVTNWSYNENYATQPTRMELIDDEWLSTMGVGADGLNIVADDLLRTGYPFEIDRRFKAAAGRFKNNVSTHDVLLWPDEYFRGVVMNREVAPGWLRYLANNDDLRNAHQNEVENGVAGRPSNLEDLSTAAQELYTRPDGSEITTVERLFMIYAKYKFFLEKYSRRSGQISMQFNPYIVPGMPLLLLDHTGTRAHMMGLVSAVSWSMGPGGFSTNVSFSMGRMCDENESLLRKDWLKEDPELGTALPYLVGPDDPVYTVAENFQTYEGADLVYGSLFFPGVEKETYAAPYQFFLDREVGVDQSEAIALDGSSVPTNQWPLKIKEEFKDIASSYTEAMKYIARPVISIDEYIHFIDGIDLDEEAVYLEEVGPPRLRYIKHYAALDATAINENAEDSTETSGVELTRCSVESEVITNANVSRDHEGILDALNDQLYERDYPS